MTADRPRRVRERRPGFVLVVVLAMTMALSVLVLSLHRRALGYLEQANRIRLSQQCLNHAQAALQVAIATVRSLDQPNQVETLASTASQNQVLTFDQGSCTLALQPASGRININLLIDAQDRPNRPAIDQFLRLIDVVNRQLPQRDRLGYDLAAAVIDWTDRDDEPTSLPYVKGVNGGVESRYYQALIPPYACANRPFQTVGELRLVKGMTAVAFERLQPFITVKGKGLINVNAASAEVLQTLGPEFDEAAVAGLVSRRRLKRFESLSEIAALPGMTEGMSRGIHQYGTLGEVGDYFHVRAQAESGPVRRTIQALLKRNRAAHRVDVIHYEASY